MKTGEYTRKLAAILSADVKGYSRLMEDDEIATIATLKRCRSIIGDTVVRFHGRVVDSPGDNILAEFASVLDAVRCALEMQDRLGEENRSLDPHRRMLFRVGINIGDIIQEGERIYGEGVNIAARLEGLAEAGGICVSGTVHEHIRNKLSFRDEFIGKHTVKNISDPIGVYRIVPADGPEDSGRDHDAASDKHRHAWRSPLVVLALLLIAASCLVLVNRLRNGSGETSRSPSDPTPHAEPVLHSFENPEKDAGLWISAYEGNDIRLTIVQQNPRFGEHALRVDLPVMDYPGITCGRLPANWHPFQDFSLSLYVEALPEKGLILGVRIDDERTDSYYTRFNFEQPLRRGWNRVEIPVKLIGDAIDISMVKAVFLFLNEPPAPAVLWLDGISLE